MRLFKIAFLEAFFHLNKFLLGKHLIFHKMSHCSSPGLFPLISKILFWTVISRILCCHMCLKLTSWSFGCGKQLYCKIIQKSFRKLTVTLFINSLWVNIIYIVFGFHKCFVCLERISSNIYLKQIIFFLLIMVEF